MSPSIDALLIIFDRDLEQTQPYHDYIRYTMPCHDKHYDDFMEATTPIKTIVNPRARDSSFFTPTAFAEFTVLLGERFNPDRIEVATFEGPETRGVVLSHWSG
jgi:hypothetical protein